MVEVQNSAASEQAAGAAANAAAAGNGKQLVDLALSGEKIRVRIGFLEHVERQPLRYVFPSLSKNESPLTLVPTFLQVLGRSGCRNSTAGQLIDGFEYAYINRSRYNTHAAMCLKNIDLLLCPFPGAAKEDWWGACQRDPYLHIWLDN